MPPDDRMIRQRVLVQGVVQGVGFRPFVFQAATRLELSGYVGNTSAGVVIEIEGESAACAAFLSVLRTAPPPLAHIEAIAIQSVPFVGQRGFVIVSSDVVQQARTLVSPDMCICDDCLRELLDPQDRRHRYPFINCTNCGPRYTIIRDIPYDRPQTTMSAFRMCPDCQREYDDPLDRRFHAQPNACPVCGPRVRLSVGGDTLAEDDVAITTAQYLLSDGYVLAIKGIGGFHLACDAAGDEALAALRARKGRVHKPFALMARDLDAVRAFAHVSEAEAALLTSRARPVVLLGRREHAPISPLVAPQQTTVGVMLPYAPLHYLLLDERPLVMTSGNLSGEPIAYRNGDAEARLGTLADAFLLHDRDIHVPCDDSVVRIFQGAEVPIRRSRGYAPYPIKLPLRSKPLLAVGGELKNTFCLVQDGHAFMSQHIGDVENLETLDALARAVDHMDALFRIAPQRVVCDLHPRYLSSGWAEQYAQRRALPLVRVQHHHAHIAALMAEHGLDGGTPVIGLCFDGTGYGTDGAIWGGEVLIADYRGFRRAAHLRYTPLPGGDSAIRHPARIALAHLWAAGIPWMDDLPPVAVCSEVELRIIERELERGFNVVPTSSMGRLFDAAAALAGVRETINYEAQAAMEFEALIDPSVQAAYSFDLSDQTDDAPLLIDPTPLLHELAEDARAGIATGIIAAKFHNGVAEMAAQAAARVRTKHGLATVALSGGVFQNMALLERTITALRGAGFAHILAHRLVPANDGGIALGQAVIGALRAV